MNTNQSKKEKNIDATITVNNIKIHRQTLNILLLEQLETVNPCKRQPHKMVKQTNKRRKVRNRPSIPIQTNR